MSVEKSELDLSYRSESYFWPITHETHLIAAIEGERRRNIIREAFDANTVTPLDEHYAAPVLHEQDRRALGALHPSLMGGEYLPNRQETEVESDTLSEKRTRTSKQPLTLGELVEFFLGACNLNEVLEMNELDREGAHDFTHPSSEFYPEFGRAIRAKINEWCPAEEPEESDDE